MSSFFCKLGGANVRLVVPERIRDRVVDLYAHAQVSETTERSFEVRIEEGAPPPLRPAHTSLQLAGPLEIWGVESADRLLLSNGETSTEVRYGDGAATVWLHSLLASAEYVAIHQLLPIAIGELLRTENVFALHAAAIVRDGRAMLLLGDSGAGKSTLAWRAAKLGWRVIGDDGVLLRAEGETVLASPFYREFSVEPSHADPALVRRSVRTWKGDRVKIDLPDAISASSAPLMAVCLLDRRSEECLVEPCSKTEMLAELVHQSPFLFVRTAIAASHSATLRILTRSCATTRLKMTPQVLTDDRLAGALLGEAFGLIGYEKGAARA